MLRKSISGASNRLRHTLPKLRIFPRASAGFQIKFKISCLLPLRRFGAARHSLPVEKHTTLLLPLTKQSAHYPSGLQNLSTHGAHERGHAPFLVRSTGNSLERLPRWPGLGMPRGCPEQAISQSGIHGSRGHQHEDIVHDLSGRHGQCVGRERQSNSDGTGAKLLQSCPLELSRYPPVSR